MSTLRERNRIAFFTIAIALMPILNNYQFFIKSVGLGDVIVAFALLRLLISKRTLRINSIHFPYLVFWLYGVIISFITIAIHNNFSVRDVAVRLLIFTFYTAIICFPQDEEFDKGYFRKWYINIATVCCVFVVFQSVVFYIFGRSILGVIPGLTLNYSISNYSELVSRFSSMYSYFYRPTSFFLEPAHFAQFMGPAIIFTLFDEQIRHRYIYAIFFSVSVLLSTSTNAVIIVASLWFFYLIYENIQSKSANNLLKILGIIVAIVVIIIIVSKTSDTFSYGIARIQKLISGGDASGSAYERVMKGFEIWKQLGFGEKIFGIGYGTYDSYYSMGTIQVYNGAVEYMSSMSYILVCGGIISLILFIIAIKKYLSKKDAINLAMVVFLIIIFFSSSVINTPVYAIVMLWISHNKIYMLSQSE